MEYIVMFWSRQIIDSRLEQQQQHITEITKI